ncbi:MAG: class I SAM-dependent methyltransferase [Oscillospiraceae bacterium]|nr:class I SAM-dependent methyltransferase [Oscillospiraceae bacterium]
MTYDALSKSYDALMRDVSYEDVLRFWKTILQKHRLRPETALDLACGTGSFTLLLAKEGYSVLGADLSEEMLTAAAEKCADMENAPFFIRQSMQELSLPQPVDWIVSCLDGINYLTDPEDCRETFRRCYASLTSGGAFCFDVKSENNLRGMDGQTYLDEDEDTFCVWRTDFDEKERVCSYGVDLFTRKGGLWERACEEHFQRAYTTHELTEFLREAGFVRIAAYGDLSEQAPDENTQRIFFCAEKE